MPRRFDREAEHMRRFNVPFLLLFVAALVAVFFFLPSEKVRGFQAKVMQLLSPFIRGGAVTETVVKQAVDAPVDVGTLQRDNERLLQEVERLRIYVKKYDQIIDENNKFRSLLRYKEQIPETLVAARVLRRSTANWWTTMIIDKGAAEGIGTDCPVITDVGLVGKTGKVALHTAEVMLLTDEECRVSARVEGSADARGILSGERGDLSSRPDLRLRFLNRTAKIEAGSKIYSSGDGRVFPAGIPLGKVKSVEPRDVSLEAVVDPAVDFNLIEDVFILQKEAAATK
jgi:rod shape-determining protein MreC